VENGPSRWMISDRIAIAVGTWEILRQNSSGHVGNIICSEMFTNFGDFTQQTPGLNQTKRVRVAFN